MADRAAGRRSRMTVHLFESSAEAERHELEFWRAIPVNERVLEVWRLSEEQWRLAEPAADEPGLSRSVARVHRR
jgi:hypothetical protein